MAIFDTLRAPATFRPVGSRGPALLVFGSLRTFLFLVLTGGIFFLGSDDVTYWMGGRGWVEHFPFIGGHGTFREPMVLPLALTTTVFGNDLLALVLPTFLYACGLIAVLTIWSYRRISPETAAFAALLLATSPILLVEGSVASIDVVESFFIFASILVFLAAIIEGPSWGRLLGAGALLALGAMSRETTVFVVVAYGTMFLAGYGMERRWYLVLGLGFACLMGVEVLYFALLTGHPFYRWSISLHHDSTINRWLDQGGGTPVINPVIDPFLTLLSSHYFGLLFWIGVPLSVWLFRARFSKRSSRVTCQTLAWVGVTWFFLAAAAVNPSYSSRRRW